MAVEAATNCWTLAEAALVAALPACAAFRDLVEAVDAAAAAKHVFVDELKQPESGEVYSPTELEELRYYAVVYSASDEPYSIRRAGVVNDLFIPIGTLKLFFERLIQGAEETAEVDAETSKRASDRFLKNRIGDLLAQLVDYWDKHEGPWATQATVSDGPFHTHEDERETVGHWQGVECTIRWGRDQN